MPSRDDKTPRPRATGAKRIQRAGQSGAHPAYGEPPNGPRPFPPEKPEEDYGNRGLHRRAGTYDKTHRREAPRDTRDSDKSGPRRSSRKGAG